MQFQASFLWPNSFYYQWIHHCILINFMLSPVVLPLSLPLCDMHASAPYIGTGLIIVLYTYTFHFRFVGILASHKPPATSFNFSQPASILFLTYVFTATLSVHYRLNVSICFNKCPVMSLIISVSFVLAEIMVSVLLRLILRPLPVSETRLCPCLLLVRHNKIIRKAYLMALPFLNFPI